MMKRFSVIEADPPSIREIGDGTGIKSTSVVSYNLEKLAGFGKIEHGVNGKARAIKVLTK